MSVDAKREGAPPAPLASEKHFPDQPKPSEKPFCVSVNESLPTMQPTTQPASGKAVPGAGEERLKISAKYLFVV